MAEGNGLLNRRAGFTGTGGSNPPLSAIFMPFLGGTVGKRAGRSALYGEKQTGDSRGLQIRQAFRF